MKRRAKNRSGIELVSVQGGNMNGYGKNALLVKEDEDRQNLPSSVVNSARYGDLVAQNHAIPIPRKQTSSM